jgi:hypothetical protein
MQNYTIEVESALHRDGHETVEKVIATVDAYGSLGDTDELHQTVIADDIDGAFEMAATVITERERET